MKKVRKTTRPFTYDLNQTPYDYTVAVRNRFKRLDLIECLKSYGWRFGHYTGGSDQDHPQEKELQKIKCLTEEALQIAVKRREAKGKEEKERYTHLNAEFPRIARRDKRAFLGDHCKETEENNRMGKTRDILKKFRDTKGTFHAQLGTVKDRSGMYLTEAEDIKKRWQEYTEELYKKDL